jgi:hypothetical protein
MHRSGLRKDNARVKSYALVSHLVVRPELFKTGDRSMIVIAPERAPMTNFEPRSTAYSSPRRNGGIQHRSTVCKNVSVRLVIQPVSSLKAIIECSLYLIVEAGRGVASSSPRSCASAASEPRGAGC